ncbi:MAG: NUDIX hydrolase [Prochlorothrix sp.]|nr:NUDIX hydrolase [Prochlorothrix sp.]
MTLIQTWEVLNSAWAFRHRWYNLRQDKVRLPSGLVLSDYFVSLRPEIALVIPVTIDAKVLLVRQYRHGRGEILLELPAGSFDPQRETALAAAQRELREETGYGGDRWIPLGILADNPVRDTNQLHLFLAPDVTYQGVPTPDPSEQIEVVLYPLAQIRSALVAGKIRVAGSMAGLFLALEHYDAGTGTFRHGGRQDL